MTYARLFNRLTPALCPVWPLLQEGKLLRDIFRIANEHRSKNIPGEKLPGVAGSNQVAKVVKDLSPSVLCI